MVTLSWFEPVMSGGAGAEAGARYKTFCSWRQQQLVAAAVRKLQLSGFYWGTISGGEASRLLSAQPAGTFLLRDSADHRHFFTLSVQTACGAKNLRVQCDSGAFFLETEPCSAQSAPRFDCLLKLVHHYMRTEQGGAAAHGPPSSSCSSSSSSSGPYFIFSGEEKVPLVLLRPLCSSTSSLQHLCRKTVNGHLEACGRTDQLPHPIQDFLEEYDAPI